jgi:hypothetical protein
MGFFQWAVLGMGIIIILLLSIIAHDIEKLLEAYHYPNNIGDDEE